MTQVLISALYRAPQCLHTQHPPLGRVGALPAKAAEGSDHRVNQDSAKQPQFGLYRSKLVLFEWTHAGVSLCQGKETLQIILALNFYFSLIRTVPFVLWAWSLLPLSGNICKRITSVKKGRKVSLLDQEVVLNFLTSPDGSCLTTPASGQPQLVFSGHLGPDLLPLTLPQRAAGGRDFLVS